MDRFRGYPCIRDKLGSVSTKSLKTSIIVLYTYLPMLQQNHGNKDQSVQQVKTSTQNKENDNIARGHMGYRWRNVISD